MYVTCLLRQRSGGQVACVDGVWCQALFAEKTPPVPRVNTTELHGTIQFCCLKQYNLDLLFKFTFFHWSFILMPAWLCPRQFVTSDSHTDLIPSVFHLGIPVYGALIRNLVFRRSSPRYGWNIADMGWKHNHSFILSVSLCHLALSPPHNLIHLALPPSLLTLHTIKNGCIRVIILLRGHFSRVVTDSWSSKRIFFPVLWSLRLGYDVAGGGLAILPGRPCRPSDVRRWEDPGCGEQPAVCSSSSLQRRLIDYVWMPAIRRSVTTAPATGFLPTPIQALCKP